MIETSFTPNGDTVKDDWVDATGHMNAAYYILVFEKATDAFFDDACIGEEYAERTRCSTFSVEMHLQQEQRLRSRDSVRIVTQLLGFDYKRIHFIHCMYYADRDHLVATLEQLSIHVDLSSRRSTPFPENIVAHLSDIKIHDDGLPRPKKVGQSINFGNTDD